MTTRRFGPRAAALLAAAAFALHQLRYLFGYGDASHRELAGQGHAYMALLAPFVAAALLIAAAEVCVRILDARSARPGAPSPGLHRLWAGATGLLLSAYCLQEAIEGALAAGHPGGVVGIFGHGGWAALPLAAAIGFFVALALRGADRAIELAAEPPLRVLRPRPLLSLAALGPGHRRGGRRSVRPLGARAPPLISIA